MFNPAKASENIKNEYIDYVSTTHTFRNQSLQKQFVEGLNGMVAKGPMLEIKDIFKSGGTIEDLICDGTLSPLFRDLEASKPKTSLYRPKLPIDRPLYEHQEKAIRHIASGHNAVVSTGTGSGKTNCFLIPVINDLLREKEAGTLGDGVRALFIYPMNALANDQMKNIRSILMMYPDITFGVYNGATEEEEANSILVYEAMFGSDAVPELRHRLPNELLSRKEMKATPPNILFTNYAMLEHLLLRPKDDTLFSCSDFRFIVLDEAHVYTGATGIETSLLLRRLKARMNSTRKTQFILTSATLGSGDSADDDIVVFAENLCGEPFSKADIIKGTRVAYSFAGQETHYPNEIYKDLANDENVVKDIFAKYGLTFGNASEEELLFDFIYSSDLYHIMRRHMCQKTSATANLVELANVLSIDVETTIAFIALCTRAQKGGKSLIDARYHFFIRALEGCYATIGEDPKLFLTRQKTTFVNGQQKAVFEIAVCSDCGRIAYVGRESDRKLVQPTGFDSDVEYYFPVKDENDEIDAEDDGGKKNSHYYLCSKCGALTPVDQAHHAPCDCGKDQYVEVIKAKVLEAGGRCGNCKTGVYKRIYLGNDAATGVLAIALYEELPELAYEESADVTATVKKNIFAKGALTNKKIAKRTGRQFLSFSDSRQEAAKFACYLGKSYNEFLRRRGICQVIKQEGTNAQNQLYTISDYVGLLTNFFTTTKSFAQSNVDDSNLTVSSRKNAWVAMLNELGRLNSSTSLTALGLLQFEYMGNTPEIVESVAETYNVSTSVAKNLMEMLAYEIVKAGAIVTDNATDIDDNDREYIFYTPSQRFIAYNLPPKDKKPTITNWAARNRENETDKYYKNNRMYQVCRALKISEKEAFEFLEQYFQYLTDPGFGNNYCMDSPNKNGTFVMPARYFRVRVAGDPDAHWYKCKQCGRISQFMFDGHCSSVRCNGTVEEIDPFELNKNNHFANLYLSDRMSPLFIKEHTAQLSKKEAAEYQEQFIKKEINALSCSTTFEMGVDVGDLETVFLRDVPPLPSNYAQRAGRAGRSVNAAAYALTYAKLSSHDLSFFEAPQQMIEGIIAPPLFKVDNEKIVRRHIFAVALAMFFAENEYYYNHNDAKVFINDKGYVKFIDWISSKPDRLKDMLKKSIPDMNGLHDRMGINDFSWIDSFSGPEGVFTELITEYERTVQEFRKQIDLLKREDLSKAASCEKRLAVYMSNRLIDFLARGNILPRYGFPVDTVELYQNSTASNVSKLRLNRDLQMAIAEYAPSSEVIADGKLYTSRYIKKASVTKNHKDWYIAYIAKCDDPNCQTINYSLTPPLKDSCTCSSCGKTLPRTLFYESIEPRSGFVAEREAKEVPLRRQEKNYRSEDFYIGNTASKTINKFVYNFNGVEVEVESTTNDSLMVKSIRNFYVCPICGCAYSEDEGVGDRSAQLQMLSGFPEVTIAKDHESVYGQFKCSGHTFVRRSLHHVFNTDVAKINFGCDTSDYQTMVSVMYAILYSVAKDLNIEKRDIKACLSKKIIAGSQTQYSIIIYDAVPGGAGHSRRLVTTDGQMLLSIMKSALARMENCKCEPSCYNCLRSYENQKLHDVLDRRKAADFLKQFID